ncbi:Importin-alpha, importin-beta-binding domain [Sesbania bispinosa]|nr:Importin-alpha, importin-beta-binding domain [Sesbania bispinosa]
MSRRQKSIRMRKGKREHTLLNKRNHLLPLHHHHHASDFTLFTTLEGNDIPDLVQGIWSEDPAAQVEATTEFRKLLSNSSPQIDEVVKEGLVPRFVEFLGSNDLPNLQYEAAWTLAYITRGNSENTKVVIEQGAVPLLLKLLGSSTIDFTEKALWCLGNIAGDDWGSRDLVKLALPVLGQLINFNDKNIMSNACWALSYVTADAPNEKIQAVIEAGVCPRLIHFLHSDPSSSVIEPALRTLGNIINGDDAQTQVVLDNQLLPCLHHILTQNHKKSIMKEACWTISNITAKNEAQIQAVIEANIILPLVNLIDNADFDIKGEATWAIYNAICGGSHDQIKFLTSQGCIKALCDLLTCPDTNIVKICLEGLESILKVGEAIDEETRLEGGLNVYAQMVQDCEGLEKIENLDNFDDHELYVQAVDILGTYFIDVLEDDSSDGGDGFY